MTAYTEDIIHDLPADLDLVFVSSFTQASFVAYSLSRLFQSRGAVTALGGPHARCYPQDASRFFDYVFGFTSRELVRLALADCAPHRPAGMRLSAPRQPLDLPGVQERWKFIRETLTKATVIKIVPMIGSMGCPYTCSFCIDAEVPYQPLSFDVIKEDLEFLRTQFARPGISSCNAILTPILPLTKYAYPIMIFGRLRSMLCLHQMCGLDLIPPCQVSDGAG